MISAPRIAFALTVVLAAATAAPACSSKEPSHPPELGNCIAPPDASCGTVGSSGSPSPPGTDGSANMDTGIADAGACGTAATLISTSNLDCVQCIEVGLDGGANCCLVDFACSQTAGCNALLACAEACAANDTTCVANCESQWPNAVTVYNDFAECITISCRPECPALPQATVVDP